MFWLQVQLWVIRLNIKDPGDRGLAVDVTGVKHAS